jgi:hypothetical protein
MLAIEAGQGPALARGIQSVMGFFSFIGLTRVTS